MLNHAIEQWPPEYRLSPKQFERFEYQELSFETGNDFDLSDLARQSAELTTKRLMKIVPELFRFGHAKSDVSNAYCAWLTYILMKTEIPKICSLAETDRLNRYEEIRLQTAVAPQIARKILSERNPSFAQQKIETISGVQAQKLRNPRVIFKKWCTNGEGVKCKKNYSNGVAFLVGTIGEAKWMAELVDMLPNHVPANLILKRKDPEIFDFFDNRWHDRAVSVNTWKGMSSGCLLNQEFQNVTQKLLDLINFLVSQEGEALRYHSHWLLKFFNIAVGAIGLARYLGPKLIVGSMEKSPQGLVLSALAPHLGIKTFNIQHGNIGRQRTLDLISFDQFGIWHKQTHDVLKTNGYQNLEKVTIVGRAGFQPMTSSQLGEATQFLKQWIGDHQCITLFLQPPKPPYVSGKRLDEIINLLMTHVDRYDNEVMLIKPHPVNSEADIKRWRKMTRQSSKIRFATSDQTAMAELLAITNRAVSLSSAALQEATIAGCNAIAYDPEDQLQILQMDFPQEVEIARTREQLEAFLKSPISKQATVVEPNDFISKTSKIIEEMRTE